MWAPVFSSILSCVFAGWFLRLGSMSRKFSGWTNFKFNQFILTAWITVTICINFLCVLFLRGDGKWQHIHTIYNFDFSHLWNFQQFLKAVLFSAILLTTMYDVGFQASWILFRPLTRFLSNTLLPISSSDDTADLSCCFFSFSSFQFDSIVGTLHSFLHPIVMKLNPLIRINASITWGIKYIIHW